MTSAQSSPAVPTVVYAVDPLCGWCFAIGDEARAARAALAESVHWEVALGGLVTGDRVGPISKDADYLRRNAPSAERASGRRFGVAYWRRLVEPGTWVHDSGPPVRAVVATRDLAGDAAAIDVHQALCDGMFVHGRAPDDPSQVQAVTSALGLDAEAIVERWQSAAGHAAARAESARARSMGITTYPSMFLRRGPHLLDPVFTGFATSAQIVAAVAEATARAGTQHTHPPLPLH
jgi:putative protein-disulfide isomerase